MAGRDPYQILGITKDATDAAVRKAYKKLARRYHPDVNPGDAHAEERFKEISEAYALLSDPEKRRAYDQFGTAGNPFAGGGGGGGAWTDLGGHPFDPGGGLGDLFARMFRGGAPQGTRRRRARGADLSAVIRIGFVDALRGLTMPLRITRQVNCTACRGRGTRPGSTPTVCGRCGGRGQVATRHGPLSVGSPCPDCRGSGRSNTEACPSCHGSGQETRQENIQVKIPAGVADGTRLRVAGKGHAGDAGAPCGDLHVTVQVASHPVFSRRGNNLYCTVPITVSEAVLGARIEVPTVDGSARLTVPPGTQPGQHVRLRGKGAPGRGGKRGDQFVEIEVVIPRHVDATTRDLIEQLGRHIQPAPRDRLLARSG